MADEVNQANEAFQQGADKLKDVANDVTQKVNDGVERARQRGQDILRNAQARSSEMWEKTRTRTSELWNDAQDRSEDVWDDAKTWIRRNPGKAVGYAFLAGLVSHVIFGGDND